MRSNFYASPPLEKSFLLIWLTQKFNPWQTAPGKPSEFSFIPVSVNLLQLKAQSTEGAVVNSLPSTRKTCLRQKTMIAGAKRCVFAPWQFVQNS